MLPPFYPAQVVVHGDAPGFTGVTFQPLTADLHWAVTPTGQVVAVYGRSNPRIVGVNKMGFRILSLLTPLRKRVDAADAEKLLRAAATEIELHAATAQVDAKRFIAKLSRPTTYPEAFGVYGDAEGNIWVARPSLGKEGVTFEVFSSTGDQTCTIVLEGSEEGLRLRMLSIGRYFLYVVRNVEPWVQVIEAFELPEPCGGR